VVDGGEGVMIDTPTTRALKRQRQRRHQSDFFARMPVRVAMLVARLHPYALILFLLIKRQADMRWKAPFRISKPDLDRLGISPQTRNRALSALERAGYIRVNRKRGRLPEIWLLDPPSAE